MSKVNNYAKLLAEMQRQRLLVTVVETLREGTDLNTSLAEFIDGINSTDEVKLLAGHITLGEIFDGILQPGQAVAVAPAKPAAVARPAAHPAPKPAKAPQAPKAPRPPVQPGERQRADRETVQKRLDTIVEILRNNGDWMKTSAILERSADYGTLFDGMVANTLSQYLAKLNKERPKRLKNRGRKATSEYRIA